MSHSTPRDVGTYLERLDEGPEQRADAFASVEQLDESHDAKQSEEVDLDNGRAVKLHSAAVTRTSHHLHHHRLH